MSLDDTSSMDFLRQRIEKLKLNDGHDIEKRKLNDVNDWMQAEPIDEEAAPREVYVLIFNEGSQNEGIYSLQLDANRMDVIVTWERETDAFEYAQQLEAQNMPLPSPKLLSMKEIKSFCTESGHHLGLVREGNKISPPNRNAEKFGWTPGGCEAAASPGLPPQREADGAFSETELDAIRLRLERTRLDWTGAD